LQKFFKKALEVCNYALDRFAEDGKRRIPDELYSYKRNLELIDGGDSLVAEQVLQTVSEKLRNNPGWSYTET